MPKIICPKHGTQYATLVSKDIGKALEEKDRSIDVYCIREVLFDDEYSRLYFDKNSLVLFGLKPNAIYDTLSSEVLSHLTPICEVCFHDFFELREGNKKFSMS